MSGTITVYVPEGDTTPYTILASSDVDAAYGDMLDEVYGTVQIAGMEFDTSRALQELDPVAYRCGAADYASSFTELQMPWELYVDGGDARDEWIASQLDE